MLNCDRRLWLVNHCSLALADPANDDPGALVDKVYPSAEDRLPCLLRSFDEDIGV